MNVSFNEVLRAMVVHAATENEELLLLADLMAEVLVTRFIHGLRPGLAEAVDRERLLVGVGTVMRHTLCADMTGVLTDDEYRDGISFGRLLSDTVRYLSGQHAPEGSPLRSLTPRCDKWHGLLSKGLLNGLIYDEQSDAESPN